MIQCTEGSKPGAFCESPKGVSVCKLKNNNEQKYSKLSLEGAKPTTHGGNDSDLGRENIATQPEGSFETVFLILLVCGT